MNSGAASLRPLPMMHIPLTGVAQCDAGAWRRQSGNPTGYRG